jgi:hypothetical protein
MRTRIQKPCVQPPHARVQAPKSSACAPARELVRAARLLLSAPQTSPTCATSRVVKLLRAPLFACLAWQQCTWKPHLELLGREAHQGYDDILLLLSSSRTTHTHPRHGYVSFCTCMVSERASELARAATGAVTRANAQPACTAARTHNRALSRSHICTHAHGGRLQLHPPLPSQPGAAAPVHPRAGALPGPAAAGRSWGSWKTCCGLLCGS